MSERPAQMLSSMKICQVEIQVREIAKSLKFYDHVFGWKKVPAEIYHYAVLEVPQDCPYGISLIPNPAAKAEGGGNVTLYFESPNPEELAKRANEAGGGLRFGPREMPGYGELWQIADPDGNRIGLFKKRD